MYGGVNLNTSLQSRQFLRTIWYSHLP